MVRSETDKAYLAGFLDGEGTIVIGTHGQVNRLSVRVIIGNTNKEILTNLQELWGGCLSTRQPQKEGWKACSVLEWSTSKAIEILKEVLPYLKLKKEQSLIAIQFQETINPMSNRTKFIPTEIQSLRQTLKNKIGELNHRGISLQS